MEVKKVGLLVVEVEIKRICAAILKKDNSFILNKSAVVLS